MTMTRTHLLETDLAFIGAREKFPRHQQRNGGAQVTDFGAAFSPVNTASLPPDPRTSSIAPLRTLLPVTGLVASSWTPHSRNLLIYNIKGVSRYTNPRRTLSLGREVGSEQWGSKKA